MGVIEVMEDLGLRLSICLSSVSHTASKPLNGFHLEFKEKGISTDPVSTDISTDPVQISSILKFIK